MTPEFSLYLDLVRIAASFLVLLSHTNIRVLSTRLVPGSGLGHSAVVVFFVLSGYVIAYVTDSRRTSGREYALSRFARIYSVAIPALVLTLGLDLVGQRLQPGVYDGQTTHGLAWLRMASSLMLMNESWGLSIQAFSNTPYWSINYEGWYYILFGVFTSATGASRPWLLAGAILLCGPKILLLLPVWLMGVQLHRWPGWPRWRTGSAIALFLLSLTLLIAYHQVGVDQYFRVVVEDAVGADFLLNRMTASGGFLGDYILGAIVLLNFAAFRAAAPVLGRPLVALAAPIRWSAGLTLSLYLFHRPLLLFFIAVLQGNPDSPALFIEVMALVVASIVLLGSLTERRKNWFRSVSDRVLTRVEQRVRVERVLRAET